MTMDDHLLELHGLGAQDYIPGAGLADVEQVAWRLQREPGGRPLLEGRLVPFLAEPDLGRVRALVIGCWADDPQADSRTLLVELAAHAERMPALRALFLGDITYEECEPSGIRHGDVTALAAAFPLLEEYGVRCGSEQITVRPLASQALRRLTFDGSGLPAAAVQAIARSDLPNLEHLELWLGSEEHGGGATPDDLAPILAGRRFPALRYLGLRDAGIADDLAGALASAPVLAQLRVLDLSLGTLGDDGVLALLRGQRLAHLSLLDLHHHYLTDGAMAHVRASGLSVDLSDQQQEGAGSRSVAVAD